jgi:antitoxin HigA-1
LHLQIWQLSAAHESDLINLQFCHNLSLIPSHAVCVPKRAASLTVKSVVEHRKLSRVLNEETSSDPIFKDIYAKDEAPLHPGEVLRDDIMPAIGISKTALAKRLGVSAKRLNNLLSEKIPVTVDLAMRLGTLLGHGARYWLALQMQHDLWLTEQPNTSGVTPLKTKRPSRSAIQSNLRPLPPSHKAKSPQVSKTMVR